MKLVAVLLVVGAAAAEQDLNAVHDPQADHGGNSKPDDVLSDLAFERWLQKGSGP